MVGNLDFRSKIRHIRSKTPKTGGRQTQKKKNRTEHQNLEIQEINQKWGRPSASRGPGVKTKPKNNFIAPQEFELLKVIGMGAFGKVLQVRNRHSNKVLAMKVISKRLIKRKRLHRVILMLQAQKRL